MNPLRESGKEQERGEGSEETDLRLDFCSSKPPLQCRLDFFREERASFFILLAAWSYIYNFSLTTMMMRIDSSTDLRLARAGEKSTCTKNRPQGIKPYPYHSPPIIRDLKTLPGHLRVRCASTLCEISTVHTAVGTARRNRFYSPRSHELGE